MGDKHVNKYLIYGILECIIVNLVPEMAEKTPSELLSDRGVSLHEEIGQENGVQAQAVPIAGH